MTKQEATLITIARKLSKLHPHALNDIYRILVSVKDRFAPEFLEVWAKSVCVHSSRYAISLEKAALELLAQEPVVTRLVAGADVKQGEFVTILDAKAYPIENAEKKIVLSYVDGMPRDEKGLVDFGGDRIRPEELKRSIEEFFEKGGSLQSHKTWAESALGSVVRDE